MRALRYNFSAKTFLILSGVTSISNSNGSKIKVSSSEYINNPSVEAATNDRPVGENWTHFVLLHYQYLLLF